jgi:hypothetical protein
LGEQPQNCNDQIPYGERNHSRRDDYKIIHGLHILILCASPDDRASRVGETAGTRTLPGFLGILQVVIMQILFELL